VPPTSVAVAVIEAVATNNAAKAVFNLGS